MSAREIAVQSAISNAPTSAQNALAQAFSGTASPRSAIKAHCLTCLGFDRNAIANCTGWSCPLWHYRPFQNKAEGK